jgi:outer membrane protein assembly factor BamB
LIEAGEATVTELAAPFEISQPAISKHLKVLERAGLISRGRDATRRPCRIETRALASANGWLERYMEMWETNYRRLVIVYQDQGASLGRALLGSRLESFITAIDRATGKTVWRKPREASVGWATPIAIRVNGQDQILVHGQNKVTAYNPANGEEIWSCDGPTREVVPTPAVGHGLVYCCSGRAGPTLAIRPDGKGDVTDTHVQWRTTRGSPFIPSPLLHDGVLYTVNDMSSIGAAFDAVTGQNLWQSRLGPPMREGFSASPVVVDGKVYFTNDVGQTFVLKAGRAFQLLHVNDLGEQVLASPALVDGKWYWRTASKLLAIS